MLRLGKLTDYAVLLLRELAIGFPLAENKPITQKSLSASELASRCKLPEPTVSKILKILTNGNILNSTRGANGGYNLISPPNKITIGNIITIMEGPIALTACIDDSHGNNCIQKSCSMRGHWDKVNEAVRAALEEVTLAEMTTTGLAFDPYTTNKATTNTNNLKQKEA